MNNLGNDLKDCFALTHVLNQLDKSHCSLEALNESDEIKRAEKVITNASAIGVPVVVRPQDITSGNVKLNTLFVSYIFNTRHGL